MRRMREDIPAANAICLRQLGLPIDNLIGLAAASPTDAYSQRVHLRSSSVQQGASSERVPHHTTSASQRPQLSGLPIPITRIPSSQTHRTPKTVSSSSSTTPITASPSPASSLLYSPVVPTTSSLRHTSNSATTGSRSRSGYGPNGHDQDFDPSSYATQMTTPPSSTSPLLQLDPSTSTYVAVNQLSYPSVPPPSLSSSLGSPVYSRRNSFGQGQHSRRMSGSGARVAETGSLLNRGRRMSSAAIVGPLSEETVPEYEPEFDLGEAAVVEEVGATSPSSVVALGDVDLTK